MSDVAFAEDPRLDFVQPPVTPLDKKPAGFAQNVFDELLTSWWAQGIALGQDINVPSDPNFDPLDPALIQGKEPYVRYLSEARSRPHFDAIWTRLQDYEGRRSRLAVEGGLASALTAGIIDPSNLVPFGVAKNVGVLRGALMGGASTGAVMLGTQLVQDRMAPVSSDEMTYATLMGVGFGSLFGGVVGRNIPDNPRLSQLAQTIETQSKVLDDAITAGVIANPNDRTAPTAYVARPTEPGASGIAPAFGLEKLVGKLTHFGELVSSGFRSFEDLGNALAGEMDALFNRNKLAGDAGEATQQSASLRALYWQGKAGVLLRDLESIYARYIGGGDQQAMLGGLNLPVAARRVQQAITGRGPNGKLTINEFHAEISRAHKRDKIDAADPFVKEAVDRVRSFYDEMREAGLESGMIMTPETLSKLNTRMTGWVADKQARLRTLQEKGKLTANEKAERKLLERAIEYGLNRQKIYKSALGTPTPATATAKQTQDPTSIIMRPANDTTARVDGNVTAMPNVEAMLGTGVESPGVMRAANDSFAPFTGPENEKFYLNRIWALDKVLADEAGSKKLRGILEQWYRDNPLPVDYAAKEKAERIIDDILAWAKTPRENATKEALLAKLDDLYATRGLSEAQINLLNKLKKELSPPGSLTPAQRAYVQDLAGQFNKQVKREIEVLASKDRSLFSPEELSTIDAQIAGRVDRTIAHILKTAELGEYQVGRAIESPSLARDLNIPNELVWDFIEDDVSVLARSYAQRMGMAVEYARMFGSRDAEMSILDAALQASREASGSDTAILSKIETLMDRARAMRDNALGDSYAANPLSLNRRIVQAASAYSTITTLGGAMITSLSEVMKPLMMWGFGRSFSFALKTLNDREGFRAISRDIQQLTAGGLETALHMHVQRYGEQGGVMGGQQNFVGRLFDRSTRGLINFANGPYFALNLLGPFTDILKNYSGVMSAHFLIDDAIKIASGQADDKLIANFRGLGLDIADAKRLAAMPFEREKGLNLTNIANWEDPELVRRFGVAVAAEQRRAVVTAGQANLPDLTRGFVGLGDKRREFAYLRLPFMLMNFAFASVNKTMLSALQGRDANAMMGAVGMLGAAYMVNRLKTPDSQWDKMEDGEKILRAVENSGLLAIFGDLNSKVESLSRATYGARPALGLPPRMGNLSTDAYEPFSALGPLGSRGSDLYQLFFDPTLASRDVAKTIRRAIPGQDLFYLKGLLDQVERGVLEY